MDSTSEELNAVLWNVIWPVSAVGFHQFKRWFCRFFLFAESEEANRRLYEGCRRCILFALYYTCTYAWFVYLWFTLDWTESAAQCALTPAGHAMEPSVVCLFALQLGFYSAGLYELLVQPAKERAKDWGVMVVHHIVTLSLILSCARFGAYWVGLYVLGLHDAADIFLYASDAMNKWTKLARASKTLAGPAAIARVEDVKTGTFLVFMLTFFYTRIYLFGVRFVGSACLSMVLANWTSPTMVLMWLGIAALSCMHVYWFSLILKMVYGMLISGGVLEDAREKDE